MKKEVDVFKENQGQMIKQEKKKNPKDLEKDEIIKLKKENGKLEYKKCKSKEVKNGYTIVRLVTVREVE